MSHRFPQSSQSPGIQNITIITNFFQIPRLPTINYTQYDVSFTPPIPIPRKRQEFFQRLQTTVAPGTFNPKVLYDGRSIAFSPRRLEFPGGGTGCMWNVSLSGEPPRDTQGKGVVQIRLTQTAGGLITPTDVNDLILHGNSTPKTATAVNLLQLIISQHTNILHTHTSRGYFPGDRSQELRELGIKLIAGFYHSVRPAQGRMLLQIDTSTTAVYLSGKVLDVCMNLIPRTKNLRDLMTDANRKTLEKFLKGRRVNTETTGKKTKTIYGLVPRAGEYQFEKDGVGMVTIARHFEVTHRKLQHPTMWGLLLTPKSAPRPNIVPAELCSILDGQIFKGKLPNSATRDIVKFSTAKPHERLQRINKSVEAYQASEYVAESGMMINYTPMKISAKLLPPPSVTFGGNKTTRVADGKWNVVGQTLQSPKPLEFWAAVNFYPERVVFETASRAMQSLGRCTHTLATRPPLHMRNGNPQDVEKSLGETMDECARVVNELRETMKESEKALYDFEKNIVGLGRFILVVILPDEAATILHTVKFWGDVKYGILTQCVRADKLLKANDQYWNNVALKLNARLGGLNYHASGSRTINDLKKEPYIIMGADVGHPGPRVRKPSVTSLVFSLDMHATKYASMCRIQNPRQEVIQDLREMVVSALKGFIAENKAGPGRIFFFRDGVSEGEYEKIRNEEIRAIDAAVGEVWGARTPKPKVTFVVVGKRHHAVFFPVPRDQDAGDRTGNVKAGCVVDEGITRPGYPNFYLQSHAAIQGTSRSSNYIVLQDQNFNNHLPTLQDLAFALTHVYAKATRSVSIPAPVYYADLVCTKALLHMHPVGAAQLQASDTSSVSSGQEPPLDLDAWKRVFGRVHDNMRPKMWFL
ncbi:argonaute-like protein [Laccaria bicolor S238N-H82]|uniref:Argonaute-like protein n=1 Tax=Laccaria bicolor (strain S238N-H82 / ATCC MYA-4686) TaxID=486041 RepID=B0DLH7_LACBS|nr:argonaute-like protein [Laccaria bicolor S238N-H82]EDR04649.1 argonaute-like protein [Laccaria bicolor S238N-H82]|eukprot:XP_001884821.1 argonaute-like protein [Laccaria bicolor S238N-H82]